MSVIAWIFFIFTVLGAIDRLLGNRFGLGAELERGFHMFTATALSMIGMIVLAPAMAVWLSPAFEVFYSAFGIDPSIIPASLFANDMGGAALATQVAKDEAIGKFNAFVVSSIMGCVVSFSIPFASGIVDPSKHKNMFLGFICGIVTIPLGCAIGGLVCGLGILQILFDLLPVIIISALFALGLAFAPNISLKVLQWFSKLLKVVILIGFVLGVYSYLSGMPVSESFDTFEEGAAICIRIAVTLSGAFPFLFVLGKILKRPLGFLGKKLGINDISVLALLSTTVTNAIAFSSMKDMDDRGVVLNSAFATTAAFAFGSHLAFNTAMAPDYILPTIVTKLSGGAAALLLAMLVTSKFKKRDAI